MRPNGSPEVLDELNDIPIRQVGDTVIHERWGAGRVNALSGDGDRRTARVRFAGVGDKTLMLSMAPLTKG